MFPNAKQVLFNSLFNNTRNQLKKKKKIQNKTKVPSRQIDGFRTKRIPSEPFSSSRSSSASSKSSYRDSRSRSRSPSARRSRRPPAAPKSPPIRGAQRSSGLGSHRAVSPSVIVSEKKAANERAALMNPPAPSPKKAHKDNRPPSPGMMRTSAQNPPAPSKVRHLKKSFEFS